MLSYLSFDGVCSHLRYILWEIRGSRVGNLDCRRYVQLCWIRLSQHPPVLLCGVSNYPRLHHLARAQHPPIFHLCLLPARPRASHQSQAFPPEDHHAELVPLIRSSRFPPHPPHQTLSFYFHKSNTIPPPRHPSCLRRLPLHHTMMTHATISCQQSLSSMASQWKRTGKRYLFDTRRCFWLTVSPAIYSQVIQTVTDKYLDKMKICSILNIWRARS